MPNALYPPLKPRSFGELLDAVLQIFRLSLLKCLPYATVAIIAGQVSTFYYLSRGRLPILDSNDPVGVDPVRRRHSDRGDPVDGPAAAPVRHRRRPARRRASAIYSTR